MHRNVIVELNFNNLRIHIDSPVNMEHYSQSQPDRIPRVPTKSFQQINERGDSDITFAVQNWNVIGSQACLRFNSNQQR